MKYIIIFIILFSFNIFPSNANYICIDWNGCSNKINLFTYLSNSTTVNNLQNEIWFKEISFTPLISFEEEEISDFSTTVWFNSNNIIIADDLFKDFNFEFNTDYIVYFWKELNSGISQYWYKNMIICWQELSNSWTDNFNCRKYYSESSWKWFVWGKLLEFIYPFSKNENLKGSFSNLLINQKICFKDSTLCFTFDWNNLIKLNLNETILSNSSYFNNQFIYINSIWDLNINSSIKITDLNSPLTTLIGWENYLFLQENDILKVYNKNFELIDTIDNVNIKDYIFYNNDLYFLNNLDKKNIYVFYNTGDFSKILIWDDINSKLTIFNHLLYFISNRTPYKYNLSTKKLFKKTEYLTTPVKENSLIFPLDRDSKEEIISF